MRERQGRRVRRPVHRLQQMTGIGRREQTLTQCAMPRRLAGILFALAGIIGYGAAVANAASSGTGFAVGNGNSIITNFHVVDGCTSVSIANVGSGQIKMVDQRNDIAAIQPERPISGTLRFRAVDPLKPGEEIIVIGFPLRGLLSSAPTITTGIVSSLAGLRDDRTQMQISAPVQPGNSGGPVLDRSGNVVGVVESKLDAVKAAVLTGDIPQNVNFAIQSGIVTSLLESYALRYDFGSFEKE